MSHHTLETAPSKAAFEATKTAYAEAVEDHGKTSTQAKTAGKLLADNALKVAREVGVLR